MVDASEAAAALAGLAWPLAEEVGDKALEGRSEFAPLLKAQVAGFISEGGRNQIGIPGRIASEFAIGTI